MRIKPLALLLLAVAIAGGAVYGAIRFFAPATDHAIRLVPENAAVYASAFLKPSTDQRQALRDLLERFPSAGSPAEAEATVDRLLDSLFADLGLIYTDDVKPWIGHEVGAFMLPLEEGVDPDAAVLIATQDEEEALESVRRSGFHGASSQYRSETYRGVSYGSSPGGSSSSVIDGFLVLGTQGAIKAVIEVAGEDRSLADTSRFSDAIERLPEDRLGLFYADPDRLLAELPTGAGLWPRSISALVGSASGPTAGALYVRPDAVVIDAVGSTLPSAGRGSSAEAGSMLDGVSENAWGVIDLPRLGSSLDDLLSRLVAGAVPGGFGDSFLEEAFREETGLSLHKDLLDWMGDAAFFVQGTEPDAVGGGLVIETFDPSRSARVVDRVHGLILARTDARVAEFRPPPGSRPAPQVTTGFTVLERGVPQSLNVAATDDRVVIAYGDRATSETLRGTGGFERTPAFAQARSSLGEDLRLSAVVFVEPLLDLVTSAQYLVGFQLPAEVLPDLQAIRHLVIGSRTQDEGSMRRIVIEVR